MTALPSNNQSSASSRLDCETVVFFALVHGNAVYAGAVATLPKFCLDSQVQELLLQHEVPFRP